MNKESSKRKVISLVSGKGGTGKSLLTAILGQALASQNVRVLIVDCDTLVRGLTILLTISSKMSSEEPAQQYELAFSDFLNRNLSEEYIDACPLAIKQITNLEYYLLPVTNRITSSFTLHNLLVPSLEFNQITMRRLLAKIPENEFDFILLDNRAGIDFLILAACRESDLVISVAEDDPVSIQTNANLVNFLRSDKEIQISNVYTIINKSRQVYTYSDLEKANKKNRINLSYLGIIPFDSDVMDDFGTERLWTSVYQTLYFRALIDNWNNLARIERLDTIKEGRYNLPPKILLSPQAGILPLLDRMLVFNGVFIIIGVILYSLFQFNLTNPTILLALFLLILGVSLIILGLVGFRKKILGNKFINEFILSSSRDD